MKNLVLSFEGSVRKPSSVKKNNRVEQKFVTLIAESIRTQKKTIQGHDPLNH